MMQLQDVQLAIMDSARPPTSGQVQCEQLTTQRRLIRGLKRFALVSGIGAIVLLLPLLHACGLLTIVLAGPVMGVLAFKPSVLLGEGVLQCPKCAAQVALPAGTPGWPARMHCGECGSTFFIRPSPPSAAAPGER